MLQISKYFVGMVWQWKSVAERPRTVLDGLGAGTVVRDDEGFLSLREIRDKFKILLHVALSAGNDKETFILVNEILVVGPIPVIGGTN